MIGYVLWSDVSGDKAIIWCEDQGDLVYFHGKPEASQGAVCKGDWIQFDLTQKGNMRLAANARVLDGEGVPDLAEELIKAVSSGARQVDGTGGAAMGSNVILFPLPANRSKTIRYG
ncbi:hypothetical protein PXK01_16795 [Phaeobacter sp. PT47_59]|uniref:hypothetical protein n=1 Tax=Phaeobacter sp. PT47_59 TaxID=3029979 RepID=UPI002380818A|nr:hypothetical protein [Phaeobacter sp. PT47_59]MDE4175823.1 hypothetical protein [Phaeobacter sp. PT47_59]